MSWPLGIVHPDLSVTVSIVATVLIALSLLSWKIPRLGPFWLSLALRSGLFALLTAAVAHLLGSPLEPVFMAPGSALRLWQQIIVSLWWLLAARLAIEFAKIFLLQRSFSREGRMFSDLLAGLLYLAVGLTIASSVFGLPIGGLVATSGVIAIVLGLALQNTLADVFSGIAVGLERPYVIGDLISLEGSIEGEVIQINWRSVQIRTFGNDIATVPNSVVAKSRIINRSAPSPVRSDGVDLPCDAAAEPKRVIELIGRAILLCPEILDVPKPFVALTRIGRRSNHYTVSFSVARSGLLGDAKSNLLQQALRQFRAAGWAHTLAPAEAAATQEMTSCPELAAIALFQDLPAEARDQLQSQLIRHELEPGQILFAQGDTEASLFIVMAGVLEVNSADRGCFVPRRPDLRRRLYRRDWDADGRAACRDRHRPHALHSVRVAQGTGRTPARRAARYGPQIRALGAPRPSAARPQRGSQCRRGSDAAWPTAQSHPGILPLRPLSPASAVRLRTASGSLS